MMGKYTLVSDGEASKDKTAKPSRLTKHMASLLTVALCGFAAAGFLLATTSSRATPSSVLMDAKLRVFKPQPSIEKIQDAVQTQDTNFRLTTWPLLVEDGGDLVVSWEGQAADPLTSKDFVTLSCGPTRGENDYFRKAGVKDWGSTDTSVRFSELYMMRCNYTVVYFHYQAASGLYKAIAKVEAGMRESFDAPKHGHISLSEDETGMTVMFNSASTKTPMVRYGESAEDLSFEATGTSSTYRASDMCHAPATTIGQQSFRDPGYMHTVALTGLKPNTYYFYQYGHGGNNWSKVRRFKSRPAAGTKYANIIAYADMGTFAGPGAASTAGRVYEEVVGNGYDSFLLHFGDISYARSDGSIWDHFFHLIEPYATRVPYMIGVGNHEYDYTSGGQNDLSGGMQPSGGSFRPSWGNFGTDSAGECGVPMHHRWGVPKTGNWIYWYSFNYGGVHVIQMSSEHDWTRGSQQYQWLQHDLEQVDRSVTPWVILTAHRMMYSTQLGMDADMKVASHFRDEVEDLLFKHRVNLMLVGHQHAYERSCPVYRKECVADGKGTVHVVAGAAGYPLDTADFSTKYGNWSIRHANEYGYLRILSGPDAMRVQYVLNKNGNVYDEFIIAPWG